MKSGPLVGVKILDISHHMAGPFCTQKLGDMGADVIKVEPPGVGEWGRTRPIGDAWVTEDLNTSFISLNRNKRSLTLDLKRPEGYEIFTRLVQTADVLVGNFRPEVNRRLKTDYDSVRAINPRIIYCGITGYGEDGPYEKRPGQDLLIQGLSGVTWNAGRSSDPPIPLGTFVADATTSYMACIGILGALYHRTQTGQGQKIAVNLISSLMDVQIQELTTYINTGIVPKRSEELLAHPLINTPYGIHKTRDSYIALAMAPFDKLADALGLEELRQMRWAEGFYRRDEIFRQVADLLATRTTAEWIEHLDRFNIWCGPVHTYKELVEDPQIKHLGMIGSVQHPTAGEVRYVRCPINWSDTPAAVQSPPPLLGEHNEAILAELGYTERDIAALREKGIIQPDGKVNFRL